MSVIINGNDISLTRGDTLIINVAITKNGAPYIPQEGDSIRFALKRQITDKTPLIVKEIDTETLQMVLEAEETKLPVGQYKYDIELTTAQGYVDTFIPPASFRITEEVY